MMVQFQWYLHQVRCYKKSFPTVLFMGLMLLITACSDGGGGGGGDSTPPAVNSVSPLDSAIDVAIDTGVLAVFNEELEASSVSGASFTLVETSSSTAVSGTVSYDASTDTATFTPGADLLNGTQYTATLSTALSDVAGNAMSSDFSWNFTTVAAGDTTPPSVSSTTPGSGAVDVAINSTVAAIFSEDLDGLTVDSSSFTLVQTSGSVPVSGSVNYDAVSDTASFVPASDLLNDTEYTATLSTAVTDTTGNALTSDYSWSFTTVAAAGDTTAPVVNATVPDDTAVDVAINTTVSATFSELLNAMTVDNNSFTLVETSGSVPVSGTALYDSNTGTASFTPGADLKYDTQYTATLSTLITDLSGNALASDYSWSFTTLPAVWEQLGGQLSPSAAESEDPTMLITGSTPSVGYRHASFDIHLNTWDGAGWGNTKVHPESGNVNSSSYGTPDFATDGSNIYVAYSLYGGTYTGDEAFYDRIYVDQCTTSTAWSAWNGGNEISTPWNATYGGANAYEPAVAVAPNGTPYVAWLEADVVADPDSEDGAWVASVSGSSSTRSDILSRDDTNASYYTDVRTVGITSDDNNDTYLAQWEHDAVNQDLSHLYVSKYSSGVFTSLGASISDDYDSNNLSVPSMAVIGSDLYITYTEANASDYTQHVYVKKYSAGVWTTVGGGPVSAFSASEHYDSGNPDLLAVNDTLYLAWEESDQFTGPFIFVAYWDDVNTQWVIDGNKLNVDVARDALDPSLAYSSSDTTLYVAFEEFVDGWAQIFVKRKVINP